MVEKEKGGDIEFSNLVSTIQDNSAYWLYFHAGGMNEYYDRGKIKPLTDKQGQKNKHSQDEAFSYVRAVHGFPEEMVDSRNPEWLRYDKGEKLPKKLEYMFLSDRGFKDAYEFVTLSKYSEQKREESQTEVESPTLLSKLGLGKPKTRIVKKDKWVDETKTLAELVGGKAEEAYILTLTLNGKMEKELLDDIGRRSGACPLVRILTDKKTAESTMDYLKKNPEKYHELVESLFPEEDCPRVNKHFIKNEKQLYGIAVHNFEKNETHIANGLEKKYFTEEQIKEKESLMQNPVFGAYIDHIINSADINSRGVPLKDIIQIVGKEDTAKFFPKALQIRAKEKGVVVMVDPSYFNDSLFRALNGPGGDRVKYDRTIPETIDIIKSYFKKDGITSIGIENNTGSTLATSISPVIPFTADGHGSYISPNGHLMVLNKDENDEIHEESIQNLDEMIITSKVPGSRIKIMYVNEDIAEDVGKISGLEGKVVGFPWKTKHSLRYFGIPEMMVLTAQEHGLAESRYMNTEAFESAVKKAKEISSSKTYTDYDYEAID